MSLPLNEQTILVTGAGRGLGAWYCTFCLCPRGGEVAVNYPQQPQRAKRWSDDWAKGRLPSMPMSAMRTRSKPW